MQMDFGGEGLFGGGDSFFYPGGFDFGGEDLFGDLFGGTGGSLTYQNLLDPSMAQIFADIDALQASGFQTNSGGPGTLPAETFLGSGLTLNQILGGLSGLGGLGALGAGLYGALGGGSSGTAGRTTTQSATTSQAPMSAQQLSLLGSAGGGLMGSPGTGLLGLSNQAISNASGLMGVQNMALQNALSQPLPQLNPLIMQALGDQALGMSQGQLPGLSDPAAMQRLDQIYNPQLAMLSDTTGTALDRARMALQERGFAVPDMFEGPTQGLVGPILKGQELARGNILGQRAGAELALAQSLPQQAMQLAQGGMQLGAMPLQLALQQAQAAMQPLLLSSQIPLDLMRILQSGRGSSTTGSTVGPEPSFLQSISQAAPLFGAASGLFGAAGNMFGGGSNLSGSTRGLF